MGGRKSPFPITLANGLYKSLTACSTVQAVIKSRRFCFRQKQYLRAVYFTEMRHKRWLVSRRRSVVTAMSNTANCYLRWKQPSTSAAPMTTVKVRRYPVSLFNDTRPPGIAWLCNETRDMKIARGHMMPPPLHLFDIRCKCVT